VRGSAALASQPGCSATCDGRKPPSLAEATDLRKLRVQQADTLAGSSTCKSMTLLARGPRATQAPEGGPTFCKRFVVPFSDL